MQNVWDKSLREKCRKFAQIGAGTDREGHDFTGCGKNSIQILVLKGRGFQPRRKCRKTNAGFSL
jgi:hypothetical protein